MMQPLMFSTAFLINNSDAAPDYSISDLYNVIANKRAVRTLDRDIVIVDIGDFDRDGIAELIDSVNHKGPAVVGVDITFVSQRGAEDEYLIEKMREIRCPVMAVTVCEDDSAHGTFAISERTYFADSLPRAYEGVVSLPTKTAHGVVREFGVDFPIKSGCETQPRVCYSFPKAIAAIYKPECIEALDRRKNETEYINYPSREFMKVDYYTLNERGEDLRDKIVLLGASEDVADMHDTPIGHDVSGIEIHAYSIATILNGEYLTRLSDFWNWVIAFILCILFLLLSFSLKVGYRGLILRIVQLMMLYGVVRVGFYFYVKHHVVIDFSCSFLMITFSLFARDIYYGVLSLIHDLKRKK